MIAPDREGAAVEALARLLAGHVYSSVVQDGFARCSCGAEWFGGIASDWRAHVAAVIAAGWVPQSEVAEREALPFLGSIRLMEAMEACAREHILITETDPPEPVKPYIWCSCGWRSDQARSGPETAGNGAILHTANEMHRACVPVIRELLAERERAAAEKALRDAATAARQMTYPSSSDPDHWALWLDGRADRLGGAQ